MYNIKILSMILFLLIIGCYNCNEHFKITKQRLITGRITAKYLDYENHAVRYIKLSNFIWVHNGEKIYDLSPDDIPHLWDSTDVGDSLLKLKESLEYKVFKKNGHILTFYPRCEGKELR